MHSLTIFLSIGRSLHGQHIEREIELEAARTDRDSLMVVRTYSFFLLYGYLIVLIS